VPDVEKLENILVDLDGRRYAVVDPGKRDLHYVLGDVELPCGKTKRRHLRYTQATRAAAMKKKRYDTIRTKLHEAADVQKMAGKTVKEWDVELSNFDSRATIPALFEKWIRAKMAAVEWTLSHWQNEIFRKLKFNAKANARRSVDTYLNKFKDMFGDASECVVIVGDWSQGTGHLKHSPPTMRRGLVAELRKRKYDVWLIKEFRTSKSCSKCHSGDCAPHEHEGKARHGLLRCKNVDCEQFHNRNANATRNMLRIVEAAKAGTGRPADMARAA
jgi:transposase